MSFPAAGARDRRVTIQQRPAADAADSSGTPTEVGEWSTLAHVWAEKDEVGGRERFTAQQMTAPYDVRWKIGYRADMDPETVDVAKVRRVLYKSRVYDIVEAQMIGRREGVELLTLTGGTVS